VIDARHDPVTVELDLVTPLSSGALSTRVASSGLSCAGSLALRAPVSVPDAALRGLAGDFFTGLACSAASLGLLIRVRSLSTLSGSALSTS